MVGLSSPYNLVFYLAVLPQVLPSLGAGAGLAIGLTAMGGIAAAQLGVVAVAAGCNGLVGERGGRAVDCATAVALLGRRRRNRAGRGRAGRPRRRQWTLTGDISFWRATTKAWARSGTSASTSPPSAWMA